MIYPLIKYFGGKFYLAGDLIANFPTKYYFKDYHQPCIGGGSPFLQIPSNEAEYISDLNPEIINLWKIVKERNEEFVEILRTIEYTEKNFEYYRSRPCVSKMEYAISTYVKHRMSRSGRGTNFSWSTRIRRGELESVSAWNSSVDHLKWIGERIIDTNIEVMDCADHTALAQKGSFVYLDPPYMKETRVSKSVYYLEMTDNDHRRLLNVCVNSPAEIMISNYDNELYNQMLKGWRKVIFKIANHSSEQKEKQVKQEVIWMNY